MHLQQKTSRCQHSFLHSFIIHSSPLTGCDGRNIPEEISRWELMVDQFTNYFTDLNLKAGEVVKDIRSSQISRELE